MIATKKGVVLISEPDQATAELYQRTLRTTFTVIAGSDETTILHLLHKRPIIALVLEPKLFVANGWQQLVPISQVCAERGISLVLCSTLDERRRGFELGASAYLVKPTLPITLLQTVCQVIEKGRNSARV